jgi:hypothetical protein
MLKLPTVTGTHVYIQGEDIEYIDVVEAHYLIIGTRSGGRLKIYARIEDILNTNDFNIKEVPNANDKRKSLS